MAVDAAIRRLRRTVRVSAAAAVRAAAQAAVQAEAVRGVHRVQAKVSVQAAARVIAQDRVGVETGTVIPRATVTAAAPETSIRQERAAEAIPPFLNPAKTRGVLQALLSIRRRLGRGKKRPASLISRNTRIRKIRGCNGMILIVEERHQ